MYSLHYLIRYCIGPFLRHSPLHRKFTFIHSPSSAFNQPQANYLPLITANLPVSIPTTSHRASSRAPGAVETSRGDFSTPGHNRRSWRSAAPSPRHPDKFCKVLYVPSAPRLCGAKPPPLKRTPPPPNPTNLEPSQNFSNPHPTNIFEQPQHPSPPPSARTTTHPPPVLRQDNTSAHAKRSTSGHHRPALPNHSTPKPR